MLFDGAVYKVDARNFVVGIYKEDTDSFYGIRHKFGMRFIDAELNWDKGPPHGTAKVEDETPLGWYHGEFDDHEKMMEILETFSVQ